jgi:hypothetical protein
MNKSHAADSEIYIRGFKLPFSQLAEKAIVNFVSGRTFEDDIAKANADFKHRPWIRSRLAESSQNYDADLVMMMRAFDRALDGAKTGEQLVLLLRKIRGALHVETNEKGLVWDRRTQDFPKECEFYLSKLTELSLKAILSADTEFFRQLAVALEHAARPQPKYERRFMVCQAFSALYESNKKLPTAEAVQDCINESDEKPIGLSSVRFIGKKLGLRFGHATWRRRIMLRTVRCFRAERLKKQ